MVNSLELSLQGGKNSIPGWGTKIPQTGWQKKKNQTQRERLLSLLIPGRAGLHSSDPFPLGSFEFLCQLRMMCVLVIQ